MANFDRLPAIPLIASDPYLSIWIPGDTLNATEACHWSGAQKSVRGRVVVDGVRKTYLGFGNGIEAETTSLEVTPTRTISTFKAENIHLSVTFLTPALPDDPDLLSMPVTLVEWTLESADGKPHETELILELSDALCYDSACVPKLIGDNYVMNGLNVSYCGQAVQKPLSHAGDHVTIDWGYLYLCSDVPVTVMESGLRLHWTGTVQERQRIRALIAYDDIASINYFGDLCKAWYRRNGAQITDAMRCCWTRFDELTARCSALDQSVLTDAGRISQDYQKIVSAAWRQTFAAHKLIATPKGEMALLSKENDSNGCMGTVDVSYPSIPLFLKYNPELINALCRPILEFASMPVWTDDFAPHDVGRYPQATGQVYAANRIAGVRLGDTNPPVYLYPAGATIYDPTRQMPVEESGNMLVMLCAAQAFGADKALARQYRALLDKWVQYLIRFGEDPGEQLCTDDFAGHLARNVNLAAKAMVGVACYGRLTGEAKWEQHAKDMAARLLEKIGSEGNTPLTLNGDGWSMKYNLLWDKVLDLGLMPEAFYVNETRSYLPRINAYGLPLDSRLNYTKSDWACWVAALSEPEVRDAILSPIARMLRETSSRVPFSDWYETKTGRYVHFIARSVQGGVFAPMLTLDKP